MALPFFYIENVENENTVFFNEETSKHIVQVLRMQNGEQLHLTDGKGNLFVSTILDNNRKKTCVEIIQKSTPQNNNTKISIAISLLKNNTRFEWFLEKATEIGVTEIYPLICKRTEKQNFKFDRMKSILISAMLQSQQTCLPLIHEPIKYLSLLDSIQYPQKFIAHCEDESNKIQLIKQSITSSNPTLILIGPEGDFTKEEIEIALKNNYTPVALGNTRLRTETAGIVAATILMQNNKL